MPLVLERLPPPAWPSLAPFIHAWNQRDDGGMHCLHAASGSDVAAHSAELAALAPDEAAFWQILRDGRIVGTVGCEFDAALGRAWMRGPLVAAADDLDALLPLVDATLAAALPAILNFDAFPAADSTQLNNWYRSAGYTPLHVHAAMQAELGALQALPAGAVRALPSDLPAMLGLHAELFESPHLGEEAFRRALHATDCALLVARGVDAQPLGYLYVEDRPSEQEVYVHYLGVVESARGRGLGKTLLGGACRWGADRGRNGIALTVREDRPAAMELYRRSGFVETSRGRHWRRTAVA
jgi:ribosomal protein S18 acetylase RimI-like enzyme